jgi:hypothetical protein
MKKRLYLLCNLLVVGAILLIGCASEVMLSEADKEILDTATEEYRTLRDTMSPDEAREELVAKLTTEYEGVESAKLGADGYTIFIEFSDDDFAALVTLESFEFSSPSSEGNYYFEHGKRPEHTDPFASDTLPPEFINPRKTASEDTDGKTTPQSNKVLLLNPLEDNDDIWYDNHEVDEEFPVFFVDYLKEHGWTDDDIDIKSPGENTTLEDYFGFGEYGIIMYFGHGGLLKSEEGGEKYFYIQGCPATDALFQNNPQYREWRKEGKLLIVKCLYMTTYSVGIRLDLLKEKMDVLPSSYVHFSTCYGFQAASAFCSKGAKVFLGWDHRVNWNNADGNMFHMLKLMVGENYCAFDAYLDDTIVRPPFWPTFNIYPDPSSDPIATSFYLPAWINLTVTGIPEGTSFIRAKVYDENSTLLTMDDEEVGSGVTQVEMKEVGGLMLAPTETVAIVVVALGSSGEDLTTGQTTAALNAGANTPQIDLTIPETYHWILSGGENNKKKIYMSIGCELQLYLNEVFFTTLSTSTGTVERQCSIYANPGDTIRIKCHLDWNMPWEMYDHSFGALWLHRAECSTSENFVNEKFELTEGEYFGYNNDDIPNEEWPFEQTYTFPSF